MTPGTVIESRPRDWSPAPQWCVLAAGLLLWMFLVGSPVYAIVAVLPFALGVAALMKSEPPVRFEIGEEGLAFELPRSQFIRYEQLLGLAGPTDKTGSFAMQIYHPEGVIRVPDRLTVPSFDLYEFLYARLPHTADWNPEDVPSSLRGFTLEQME
jgi:hypothetical protein